MFFIPIQDSNESTEFPMLKDFSDLLVITRELSMHSSQGDSPFQNRSPLPEIGAGGSPMGSAQVTKIYKNVSIGEKW